MSLWIAQDPSFEHNLRLIAQQGLQLQNEGASFAVQEDDIIAVANTAQPPRRARRGVVQNQEDAASPIDAAAVAPGTGTGTGTCVIPSFCVIPFSGSLPCAMQILISNLFFRFY